MAEMDWSTMMHNPFVDVTKDTTTFSPAIGTSLFLPRGRD